MAGQSAWVRCLAACLPPPDAQFYEGPGDDEDQLADSTVAAGVLANVCDALADGYGLAEACAVVRDLAASRRNQDAMTVHGGWGGAQRAAALVDDEADVAWRDALRGAGGVPLLLRALDVALAAAAPGCSLNLEDVPIRLRDGQTPRDGSGTTAVEAAAAAAAAAQALRYLAFAEVGQAEILGASGVGLLVAAVRGGERTSPAVADGGGGGGCGTGGLQGNRAGQGRPIQE